ncbi:preprotein translocase subunit SecA [Bacillus sp. SA1-12]|uniref:hypothetical protein n=1 Tax=Bacillus sp. SA1-12 TaxID=1455638 RepID=UPI0006271F90|nr:hypothetical protein [Bacillus sp. SA1-12]KKI90398.1 preprotein translocase subunit SecA [Bacillus sp. SA1-12]
MFTVYFFENKNLLLSQLLRSVPSDGEELKIKGRKGKVVNVSQINENLYHVQLQLEIVNKNKVSLEQLKKKKR